MDWSAVLPLIGQAAPTIGGLLGGLIPFPGGAILGQVAGKVLGEALGVAPTPEAVKAAIVAGEPSVVAAKLSEADAKMNAEVEKFRLALLDVQDARATTVEYVKSGSSLSLGAVIVSIIVIVGFIGLSFLAMKPAAAGVDQSVVLYLLGAWQSLATGAVAFWIGSSAGSADKTQTIANLTAVPQVVRKK